MNWVTLLLVSQEGSRLSKARGLAYSVAVRGLQESTIRLRVHLKPMSVFSPLYQDALKFAPKFSRKGQ